MRTHVYIQDWVRQAQSKDAAERNDAFDHLVRDFEGMVYSVAYSRFSDSQLAEDAAQEAFLTAYKRIAQLNDVGAFPAWLKRIALTHTDRLMRRQGPPTEIGRSAGSSRFNGADAGSAIEAMESRQRVRWPSPPARRPPAMSRVIITCAANHSGRFPSG